MEGALREHVYTLRQHYPLRTDIPQLQPVIPARDEHGDLPGDTCCLISQRVNAI